jgi:hypothetical protein
MAKGMRQLTGASFVSALIPFVRALPSLPYRIPKTPPLNVVILSLRFQHMNLLAGVRKRANTQIITLLVPLCHIAKYTIVKNIVLMGHPISRVRQMLE